jgi:hypothetical protein
MFYDKLVNLQNLKSTFFYKKIIQLDPIVL